MPRQRGFFAERQYESQRAKKRRLKQQAAVYRAQVSAQRNAERALRASERAKKSAARAAARERDRLEKEASSAATAAARERDRLEKEASQRHVESQEAEVRSRNAELATYYEEVDGLLAATLGVDDYVDLESLRIVKVDHPPFEPGDLKAPANATPLRRPVYKSPRSSPFSSKEKRSELEEQARAKYEQALLEWNGAQFAEAERLRKLLEADEKYQKECRRRESDARRHNRKLTELIDGLALGVESAVQEYVDIVLSNSVYPDAFPVSHEHEFVQTKRELRLTVTVPPPSEIKTVKEYTYVKSKDEIRAVSLPLRAQKERYSNAVFQVAIRTLHEVFEADRDDKINSISLTVASYTISDASGQPETVALVIVAADRDTFSGFDLTHVVPRATLEHLGAAVSRSPFDLRPADDSWGVRIRKWVPPAIPELGPLSTIWRQ